MSVMRVSMRVMMRLCSVMKGMRVRMRGMISVCNT